MTLTREEQIKLAHTRTISASLGSLEKKFMERSILEKKLIDFNDSCNRNIFYIDCEIRRMIVVFPL